MGWLNRHGLNLPHRIRVGLVIECLEEQADLIACHGVAGLVLLVERLEQVFHPRVLLAENFVVLRPLANLHDSQDRIL